MMAAGAGLAVASAFLPWATFGPFSVAGTNGDGQITLVLGVVLGALTFGRIKGSTKVPIPGFIAAVLIAVVAGFDIATLDGASAAIGLYGTFAAGVLGAIGSFRARRFPAVSGPALPPPTLALPPAGWHPDPKGQAGLRYWDGATWTDHTANPTQP